MPNDKYHFRMGETTCDNIIHFTDNYVVHGRGFTVGDEIWFDEYSVHFSHYNLWENIIAPEYDANQYNGDWRTYDTGIDDPVLYWSLTGAPQFSVQYPELGQLTDDHIEQLQQTLRAIEYPSDEIISINRWRDDNSSHAQSILQATKNPSKNETYKCEDLLQFETAEEL